ASVELKIVRNTLARRAIKGTPAEALSAHLKGPMAIAFSYKDAAAAAKKLMEFVKVEPNLKIRAGALGARVMNLSDIKGLAELPGRDVLMARLLGSMNAPASGIVRVLAGAPRKLLYALAAIRQAKAAGAQ
ncbi:MAG: 50S ribosomal protein L10, partial [Deltaproteobacteria bacterium]|nr:50S ribosomal protein L10 [Deltaproteobacteria bacterium]